MRLRKTSWLLAGALGATPAVAQKSGSGTTPRDGACFYQDADFHGEYFCARAGEGKSSLPDGMNDSISSIRIFGRAQVTVYRDEGYRGKSAHFESDVTNLRHDDWNDKISSLQVDRVAGGGRTSSGGQNPDRIVTRAYEDILGRPPDSAGMRTYRSHIVDDGWSETDVREALRKSPEYKEKTTMTWEKAEAVVRNAYLAVLKREPDAGSRAYVDNVFRKKWTQADVERELRASAEYRNKGR